MQKTSKIPLTFITGNKKKLEEFMQIMGKELEGSYDMKSMSIDCKWL
jgi:hypothetical protein